MTQKNTLIHLRKILFISIICLSKIGFAQCNESTPPSSEPAISVSQIPAITANPNYYDSDYRYEDGLGTRGGNESGGFLDTFSGQTQIMFPYDGADVYANLTSTKYAAGDDNYMYFMTLAMGQEYYNVDMQWMMAVGTKETFTGTPYGNVSSNNTNDESAFGPFEVESFTGLDRALNSSFLFPEFEAHLDNSADATSFINNSGVTQTEFIKHYTNVTRTGNTIGYTPQNKPIVVGAYMFGMNNYYNIYNFYTYSKDVCWLPMIDGAKDKYFGLGAMTVAYNLGIYGSIGNILDTMNKDNYKTNKQDAKARDLLPSGNSNYRQNITRVVDTLIKVQTESLTDKTIPLWNRAITWQDVKDYYLGDGGTVAKQGVGGLLRHAYTNNVPRRRQIMSTLQQAFDALKGRAPGMGADEISFRYDWLTLLRTVKQQFPNDGFYRKPVKGDVNQQSVNHSRKGGCCELDILVDKKCLGDPTEFKMNKPITSVAWTITDDTGSVIYTSTTPVETYTFTQAGTYTFDAAYVTTAGVAGTATKDVTFKPLPTAPQPPDYKICDISDSAEFDLLTREGALVGNQVGVSVTFHESDPGTTIVPGTNSIQNLSNYTFMGLNKTIYVAVKNPTCVVTTTFDLIKGSITANKPADYEKCGSGIGVEFDLTSKDTEVIKTQLNVTVEYYEADPGTAATAVGTAIVNPTQYTFTGTRKKIYARAESAGCADVTDFDLIKKTSGVTAHKPTDYQKCGSIGTTVEFDLPTKRPEIIKMQTGTFTVEYYEADPGTAATAVGTAIVDPDKYTFTGSRKNVYARIESAGCIDVTDFDLIKGIALTDVTMEECENPIGGNTATFDLTSKNQDIIGSGNTLSDYTFEYYLVKSDADTDTTANTISNATTNNDTSQYESPDVTIYVRVAKTGGCASTSEITLTVNKGGTLTDVILKECETIIGGSTAVFDLKSKNQDIIGSGEKLTDYTFEYYLMQSDAQSGTSSNSVSNSATNNKISQYTSTGVTIYARVTKSGNCASIAEITLTVTKGATLTDVTIEECETTAGGNTANFDLASKNQDIIGSGRTLSDYTFEYYLAQSDAESGMSSNSISKATTNNNTSQYTSADAMIYARVTKNGGCASVVEITLTVTSGSSTLTDVTIEECETVIGSNMANFDLTSKNQDIIGSGETLSDYTFEYYLVELDADTGTSSNAISNAATNNNTAQYTSADVTIYARVTKTGSCASVSKITLTVTKGATLTDVTIEECETPVGGNMAIFDLTSKNQDIIGSGETLSDYTFEYYLVESDANTGTSANSISNSATNNNTAQYTSADATIYTRATKTGGCASIVEITLTVTKGATLTDVTIEECETTVGGNTAIFDLTSKNQDIIGSGENLADYTLEYYLAQSDAQSGTSSNAISNSATNNNTAQYVSADATIYARVTKTGGCASVVEITLTVDKGATLTDVTLTSCVTLTGGSTAIFDLTSKNQDIIGSGETLSDYTFEYYLVESDANTGTSANSISNSATNNNTTQYTSMNATVYARVTKTGGCVSVSEITLTVTRGTALTDVTVTACPIVIGGNTAIFDLTSKNQDIIGSGETLSDYTFEYYLVKSDAQSGTSSNSISNSATNNNTAQYTSMDVTIYVSATKMGGCTSISEITLTVTNVTSTLTDVTIEECPTVIGGNEANFDLASKNQDVIGTGENLADYTFEYYQVQSDANSGTSSNSISNAATNSNTAQYTSMDATIYIRATKTGGCASIAETTLTVTKVTSTLTDVTIEECETVVGGGITTFDLTSKNQDIIGAGENLVDYTFEYYLVQSDANSGIGANTISSAATNNNTAQYSSFGETVYARVTKTGGCASIAEIILTVTKGVTLTDVTIEECETIVGGGTTIFDLASKNQDIIGAGENLADYTFEYYLVKSDANSGTSSNSISNAATNNNTSQYESLDVTIYARVTKTGGCTSVSEVTLTVSKGATLTNVAIQECETVIGSNSATFDLASKNQDIIGAGENLADYTFEYYLVESDANSGTSSNTISSAATNNNTSQYASSDVTVYARVTKTGGCSSISEITLTVGSGSGVVLTDVNLQECETTVGSNSATFDLASKNQDIIGAGENLADYTFEYYLAQSDANSGTSANAISNAATNNNTSQYESPNITLYARVTKLGSCASVSEITLGVQAKPNLIYAPEDIYTCGSKLISHQFDLAAHKSSEETRAMISATRQLTFHKNVNDANNNVSDISLNSAYDGNDQDVIYTRLQENGNVCYVINNFKLQVEDIDIATIEAKNPTLLSCDDDQDGFASFDLTDAENLIAEPVTQYKYYRTKADGQADTNEITAPYTYLNKIMNKEDVYTKMRVGRSCVAYVKISLDIQKIDFNKPTDYTACQDQTNDYVLYDLSTKETEIRKNTNQSVKFYASYDNASKDIAAYTNTGSYKVNIPTANFDGNTKIETVYFRIEDASTCSHIGFFHLKIYPATASFISDIEKCESANDIASFNLYDKTKDIRNVLTKSDDLEKIYNATDVSKDLSGEQDYKTTGSTLYAQIKNSVYGCERTVDFKLIVNPAPNLDNSAVKYMLCEDLPMSTQATFDLDSQRTIILGAAQAADAKYELSYFKTKSDANNNVNAVTGISSYTTASTRLYIRAVDNTQTAGCIAIGIIDLVVNPTPIKHTIADYQKCGALNASLDFDLKSYRDIIVNNYNINLKDNDFTLHTSLSGAQNKHSDVSMDTAFNSSGQTIYTRMEDKATGCYTTSEFQLSVSPASQSIKAPSKYWSCSDRGYGAPYAFDLKSKEKEMVSNPADYTISYYRTSEDATKGVYEISNPNTYTTIQENEKIFVKLSNATTNCEETISFDIAFTEKPQVSNVSAYNCSSNNGSAIFDLTSLTNSITLDATNIISYHTTLADANSGTKTILNPTQYVSQGNALFAKVKDAKTGCYDTTNIKLEITTQTPSKKNRVVIDEQCEQDNVSNQAIFDLNNIAAKTTTTKGATVSFYNSESDAFGKKDKIAATTIDSPNRRLIARTDYSKGCYTLDTVRLNVVSKPLDKSQATDITHCSTTANQSTFDLADYYKDKVFLMANKEDYDISIRESPQDTNDKKTETAYMSASKTMYLKAEHKTANCEYIYPFDLNVGQSPIASQPMDLNECENYTTKSTATFDLSVNTPILLGGLLPTQNSVVYYESMADADREINPILPDNNYVAQRTQTVNTIYAKVTDLATKCSAIETFKYTINTLPPVKTPMSVSFCDLTNSKQAEFDLDKIKIDILNGLSASNYTIDYYETKSEAEAGTPKITNTQKYPLTSNSKQIYYDVSDTNGQCHVIAPLELLLNTKPTIIPSVDIYGCTDTAGSTVTFNLQDYSDRLSSNYLQEKFEYYDTRADADNRINRVPDNQSINSQKNLFVRIINKGDDRCSTVGSIKLDISVNPTMSATASNVLEQCDNAQYGTNKGFVEFDLTNKDNEVLGTYAGKGTHRVTYYSGMDINGELIGKLGKKYTNKTNPQKLYAALENISTGCISNVNFDIQVTGPVLNDNVELTSCGDASVSFDLSTSASLLSNNATNETFSYYTTRADAVSGGSTGKIANTTAHMINTVPSIETVYVRVEENGGGTCSNVASLKLITSKIPIKNILTDTHVCTTDLDVADNYNLLNKEREILGGQNAQDYTVSFYENSADQGNDNNRLSPIYKLTNNTTTIYIRLTNNKTGCFITNQYNIEKTDNGTLANIDQTSPATKYSCNSEFDLSSYKEKEAGILPGDLSVGYFRSANDAINNQNEIVNTARYITAKEDVYKRVFDSNIGCPYFQKYSLESQESIAPNLKITLLQECDNDANKDGFTTFDLTTAQPRLSSNNALLSFEYFETEADAKTRSNRITTINNYTNTTVKRQQIYVYAENLTTGCSQTLDFYVQVSRVPDFNRPAGIFGCATKSDQQQYGVGFRSFSFDQMGKAIVKMTEKDTDFKIDFYTTDAASRAENKSLQIKDNYINKKTPTDNIYSNVFDKTTGCYEYIPVTLTVFDTPTLQQNYELKICSDGATYTFDIDRDFNPVFNDNSVNEDIYYFNNEPDTKDNTLSITGFTNTDSRETKYVKAVNKTSGCQIIESFDIEVNAKPEMIQGVVLTQCDDEVIDGKSLFNLRDVDDRIQINKTNKVDYYLTNLDALRAVNRLNPLYTNQSNDQKIYAKSTNAAGCTTAVPFTLYVRQSVTISGSKIILEVCDDNSDGDDTNGISKFNFKNSEDIYKQRLAELGITSNYEINFYHTEKASILGKDPIENISNYINTVPNMETVYARITEPITKKCITNKASLYLLVNPLPKYDPTISDNVFCSEGRKNASLGIDLGKEVSYQWNTGETTPIITPPKEGSYSVKYTNNRTKCTYTSKPITLELSSSPKDVKINVETFRTKGKITVDAKGDGKASYVYKLDENTQFLDNPVMDDVSIGKHILTIKDINGCGAVLREILITGYIDYMTPNSDGINDTWTLKGLENTKNPIIRIYDRYNTLLAEFNPVTNTWDGNFESQKMPSDDYWFEAVYTNVDTNREDTLVGHFTLKR